MDVLLRLGPFRFAVETAAYDCLKHTVEHRWPSQERLWNANAIQYTGRGDEIIELSGRILPTWKGGLDQINRLRLMAAADLYLMPVPWPLISGYGEYLGEYAIETVEELHRMILTRGAPGEQAFRLTLKRYFWDRF